ncbi:hypothetical protein KAW50_06090 [candidate division WOR-3 bacterium]|nr:hypothetical protein [candidate division WOR-3 bacterium]
MRSQLKDFDDNWYISTLPEVINDNESNNFKSFKYDGPWCESGWAHTYEIKCRAKDTDTTLVTATPEKVTH